MALSLTACADDTGDERPERPDKDNNSYSVKDKDEDSGYTVYPNECDFLIEERDDGVAIVEYISTDYESTELVIPPTIGGKKVVEIAYPTRFYSNLENITIPDSVTKFYYQAFSNTAWYKNKLEESPFVIVNNIVIGADPEKCTGSVTIPNGVTGISDYAFSQCMGLTSITLPEGLTEIGEYAFYNCTNLADITVPDSVNETSRGAFYGTPWLKSKPQESGMLVIGSVLFDGHGCSGSVTIPDGVTTIGELAFSDCKDLTEVKIPKGVTKIGTSAFSDCTNLTNVTIPNGVTTIGYDAFSDCTSGV